MHPRTLRFRTGAVALATVLGVLAALAFPLGSLPTAGAFEPLPRYQPQTRCAPKPKPGTVKLAEHLLRRYPGSGSSGISRPCSSGGVSEHKEGRAFDWRLSATSARDRGYARNFVRRLQRTDRAGHRYALGRRMGVMYVIWDDRIYSATTGYAARRYRHAACPKGRLRRCSATYRHRDHMHISLSWAGARTRTSWYDPVVWRTGRAVARARATATATVRQTAAVRDVTATATRRGVTATATVPRVSAAARVEVRARAKSRSAGKAERRAERKARRKAERKAERRAERKAHRKAEQRAEHRAERCALRKAERRAERKAHRKAIRKVTRILRGADRRR